MNLIAILPYVAIILANVLYLYTRGLQEKLEFFQVFLYNFIIMVFAGIFIIINLNIMLHRWLVQEVDKNQDGKMTKKQVIKKKVVELINLKNFIEDLFNTGNEIFLVKIYLGIVVFRWLWSLVPGTLVGLLFGLYYQFKQQVDNFLRPFVLKGNQLYRTVANKVLRSMPRYQGITSPPPQLDQYTPEPETPPKDAQAKEVKNQ